MPAGKIQIYSMGHAGVVVDMNPVEPSLPVDSLINAQNANHHSISGYGGAIRKRPGLRQFNVANAGGAILGGIPMAVAGTGGAPVPPNKPGINPPTGDPITSPPQGVPGPGTPTGSPPGGVGGGTVFSPVRLFNGARLIAIGRGDTNEGSNVYGSGWFVGDEKFADQANIILTGSGDGQTLAGPPGGTQATVFDPATSGSLTTIANGVLYYPTPTGPPAVAPVLPTVRKLTPDGQLDKLVFSIPDNPSVLALATVPSHAVSINSMLTEFGNGDAMYVSVFDNVTTGASTGLYGRVFRVSGLDSGSITIKEIFNAFNTNASGQFNGTPTVPYALENFAGAVWIGLFTGSATRHPSFAQIRQDTTQPDGWGIASGTTDSTASYADVGCMSEYKGIMYIGYINRGAGVTAAVINNWNATNGYGVTAVLTATTGGAAADPNGFVSMVRFNGFLFASYYNALTIAEIYKFDGTTWTIVYTGNQASTIHPLTLKVDSGTLYAYGTRTALSLRPLFLWSPDGTTWNDATTQFPFTNSGFSIPVLFGCTQP